MGLFFKNKRNVKNSSDNNITINQQHSIDIQKGIELMFDFMKDMKKELKADMREINEQIKYTSQRLDSVQIKVNVLEKINEKKGN